MLSPGDVISYLEMCAPFGVNLQRGMNYRIRNGESLILMSQRSGAPYQDRVEQDGRIIIYEGHDLPRTISVPNPKTIDQPEFQPNGRPTQNGLFAEAARKFKDGTASPERVRVFEKIRNGIWTYNGVFELIDSWREKSSARNVFKFKLQLVGDVPFSDGSRSVYLEHDRVIPTHIKLEVWKRDKGCCVRCGSSKNLHFDHIIPYSLGGSSKAAENIQLLCAKHNLEKHDSIQ
ncbi:MAG: HNH endonuclease [Terriglobales bacterium]